MKYLLAIDIQKEFTKGEAGEKIYQNCLKFIADAKSNGYDEVIAAVYKQSEGFGNMDKLLDWHEMHEIAPLEFEPDRVCMHSGYQMRAFPDIHKNDEVHIIGFDTDACVLAACFDVFEIQCDMKILTDYIYSSGGLEMHMAGLKVLRRQFRKALV